MELASFACATSLGAALLSLRRSTRPETTPKASSALGLAARPLFPTDFAAVMVEAPARLCTVHLNHGSYGVCPLEVTAAQRAHADVVERWPDDHFRRKALPKFLAAADACAAFLGAPPASVVFVENATTGVNAVLGSLRLGAGDAVLINSHTYNACKNAASQVCERAGAVLVTQPIALPLPAAGADGVVADFERFVDGFHAGAGAPRIRFALIDHITSPTAVVMPVARLAAACRARGILCMIDGAHAPGQLELNLSAVPCDWYTGNLHKWCFAPKGVAVLFTRPEHQAETQAAVVSHFYKKSYGERFFMQGTNDQSRLLASTEALRFVEERLGGFGRMRAYNSALATAGSALIAKAWGTRTLLTEPAHVVLGSPFLVVIECPLNWRKWVRLPAASGGGDASGLGEAAAESALAADEGFNERVACAVLFGYGVNSVFFPWRHDGKTKLWCRVSAQVYNVLQDYETLAQAVLDLKARE